ncbi:MAG: 30S ribosomal protein S17 [Acidobacteria bacterium]|nr:30S ribosomal protein S17 [Acidobacteriota bacterium]
MANQRQEKVGIVSSNKMQKTVVVTVVRQVSHPLYKRVVRYSKNFMVHDEKNQCQVGDTVRIVETRPLSARKRWRVAEIVAKATQAAALPEGLA